jgi:hypothetical protein
MKSTLKDVVLGTPAGNKAMEEALKKSCEDQVKLLEKAKIEAECKRGEE